MEENKNIAIENATEQEEKSLIDFQKIYQTLILNWKWFVLSLIFCLGLAAIYLRYTTPIYQAYAKLIIKEERGGSKANLMNSMTFGTIANTSGIETEIEILRSRFLAEQTVRDLKLYTTYKSIGRVMENLLYLNQPITVDIDPAHLEK
ncbi:MAG: capsid assembly protein, partial [Prevotella sp.]|nr:capsid assembly protein [Prevotella sp.]